MQARDMGMCPIDSQNLLQNPGFETPSVEPDGNGKAVNTGSPASSIPGKWDGCCNQSGGGTTWMVSLGTPRCGLRSLQVTSTSATANVLNQSLQLPSKVGKTLTASAYVFVQQASAISNLLDSTEVVSFFAPYVCPRCGLDEEQLIDVRRDLYSLQGTLERKPPSFGCVRCGTAMMFDDIPERYFMFL